jgi:hypothetical protein
MTALKLAMRVKPTQAFQYRIMAGDFTMLKTVGATPYGKHELGNELLGSVAPIAPRLWQARSTERSIKMQMIQHAFHDPHAAPSGDFFVGKTKVKVHEYPHTEIAIPYFSFGIG